MKTRLLTLLVLAPLWLAGCASTTPEYDKRFGDAVRLARQQMTINSEAGKQADPVAGLDGPSAREAVQRYQDSFKAPPPVNNVINIGGAVGSQ
jgi:uncharacterized protein YceK